MAMAFLAAAAVSAPLADGRWLPLHLLLAGAVVLAISGVSLMLTVTWSAAPAPSDAWAWVQRLAVAGGAAGVAAGRERDLPDAVLGLAGAAYLGGLLLLGVLLVVTVRRGVERRFDVAVGAYVAALAAGGGAVAVGVVMALDRPTTALRSAHVALNLLGLVGLVVGGTLPFFAATVGRARMASQATSTRLGWTVAGQATALAVTVAGLVAGSDAVTAAGLVAYALALLAVASVLPRPTGRQWRWAGPRLAGLWAGLAWWVAAVVTTAVQVVTDGGPLLAGRWLLVLVLPGYLQILWGSLAYLLPMLRGGGHERLGEGFATTRSWLGLAAANVAGAALVAGLSEVVAVALAAWALDTAVRVGRVLLAPRL
jgi:nitrite reductase (NO-forming)